MSNHYAYQTHGMYKNLVADIVHSLRKGDWPNEKEVLESLPAIPAGRGDMSIHFCVTKQGSIVLIAMEGTTELAHWHLDASDTGVVVDEASIMSIGRLQNTLEHFWDAYINKCTRIDMNHHRRGMTPQTMRSRHYFADQALRSWLEHKCVDITLRPGEVRIGNDVYHTNRSWRRSVRDMVGLSEK